MQITRPSPALVKKMKRYRGVKPCRDFTDFGIEVLPLLHHVGIFIADDIILMTKVWALFRESIVFPVLNSSCCLLFCTARMS